MPQLNEQMKEDMQKIQDRDEKDTEESEDASVADETVKEPETVAPEVTATPEPTQETITGAGSRNSNCSTDTAGRHRNRLRRLRFRNSIRKRQPVTQGLQVIPGSGDYVIPDSSTRYLTNADLNGLSEWQIRIARNEIYARHGRIFKSDDLADYFASKSWYTPSVSADQFDNSYLNCDRDREPETDHRL